MATNKFMNPPADGVQLASCADDPALRSDACNANAAEPVDPLAIWGDEPEVPLLPRNVLPHTLEQLAFAKRSLYPEAALGMSALAACSMAASDNWKVAINETYKERFCIWVGLVGSSATGKSPTISLAMRPLNALQSEMIEAWKSSTDQRAEREAVAKMQKTAFSEPNAKLMRLTTQNATIEALTQLESDNDHGIGLVHDELSSVLSAMDGGYKEKSANDRGHWLALYDGGPHTTDRIGRGAVFVKNHSAAILGGITTDKLRGMVNTMSADGLMARMSLVLMPAASPSEDLTSVDFETFKAYNKLVRRIVENRPEREVIVPMTDAARCTLGKAKRGWQEFAIRQQNYLPRFSERLNKLLGLSSRIALGFAIIEAAEAIEAGTERRMRVDAVDDNQMRRAVALVDHLATHDLAFYAGLAGRDVSPPLTLARQIAGWLLRSATETFRVRELTQQVFQWRTAKPLDQYGAVAFLETAGWIFCATPDGGDVFRGNSFRRGVTWSVNPAIHTRFVEQRDAELRRTTELKARIERSAADRRASREDSTDW